jgi:pimeloyl-ACP methyl ester carboxylesterase
MPAWGAAATVGRMSALRIAVIGAATLTTMVGTAAAAAALECYEASDALLAPHTLSVPGSDLDPGSALGLRFQTVRVSGPLGPAPAWYIRGSTTRWAIVVHGMGAPRAEGLPLLPVLHGLGLSTLVISYRNDPDAPASPDGLTHLGADEWHDLDAAARYAEEHGARQLTLIGYSMGGMMICDFLRHSTRAAQVTSVVLDAPVLEWRQPLAIAAAHAGVPGPMIGPSEAMISWRIGIGFSQEDQLAHSADLNVPMLLLHGTADAIVPIADSRTLAAMLPGQVRLVEFPGAGHAASWQSNPRRYVAVVRDFLRAA